MKYDLTWGESVCVRQAFVDNQHNQATFFDNYTLMGDFGYPKHEGDQALISVTADVIKRQTGEAYKHIFLTNGATGAVTMAMRSMGHLGYNAILTSKPPYFSLYPGMVRSANMMHITEQGNWGLDEFAQLVDSPSNPAGTIGFVKSTKAQPTTIWDAVYHNRVYTNGKIGTIPHDVVCGSFSKLTGLNGIRIGWVATNDDLIATHLTEIVTSEYCGLSYASTRVLLNCLDNFDWDMFEENARFRLDLNRTEWQRVTRYFDAEVPSNGMFYYSSIDESAKKLMQKAHVYFQPGSKMDTDDGFARFNLGQDNALIREAVAAIRKADKL